MKHAQKRINNYAERNTKIWEAGAWDMYWRYAETKSEIEDKNHESITCTYTHKKTEMWIPTNTRTLIYLHTKRIQQWEVGGEEWVAGKDVTIRTERNRRQKQKFVSKERIDTNKNPQARIQKYNIHTKTNNTHKYTIRYQWQQNLAQEKAAVKQNRQNKKTITGSFTQIQIQERSPKKHPFKR